MNSLSWAIYFAEIVESVGSLLDFLCFLTGFLALFFLVFYAMHTINEGEEGERKSLRKCLFFSLLGCFFIWPITALIPSKETVYAIVASETAEAGLDYIITQSNDDKTIVSKGLKKLESLLEVKDKE